MTNISKDKLKNLVKATLDNVLSIAANNLTFEAAISFNSNFESKYYKEKVFAIFTKAIDRELAQAKEQSMIYLDDLFFEDDEKPLKEKYTKEIVSELLDILFLSHLSSDEENTIRIYWYDISNNSNFKQFKLAVESRLIDCIELFDALICRPQTIYNCQDIERRNAERSRLLLWLSKCKKLLHRSQTEF